MERRDVTSDQIYSGSHHNRDYNRDYYTSEEFFLYKTTVDKWTIHHFSRQNELLTGTYNVVFRLLHSYDVLVHFYGILTSDWLDDVIKSAAPYVTMKYMKTKHDRDLQK